MEFVESFGFLVLFVMKVIMKYMFKYIDNIWVEDRGGNVNSVVMCLFVEREVVYIRLFMLVFCLKI